MQRPITFLFLVFLLSCPTVFLNAQGCVAIRHFSCAVGNTLDSNAYSEGELRLGMNYRFFESFRHFRGTEEEPDRVSNNTEVVNYSNSWDLTLSYGITSRWYVGITIPTVINERSSLYEHGRNERNKTTSRGLGDIRLGGGYWLFDPLVSDNMNVAIGLALKLPTGNYSATDIFYNVGPKGSPEVRPVDQSIQPGDGGFGFALDFQYYQRIVNKLYGYAGGFYLFNPRGINGTRTFRETLSPILQNEAIMAVPDQFSIRGGLSYSFSSKIASSLGARYEGVPVEDVFGPDYGFRRPGNVVSIEPGISCTLNNLALNLSVPVAVRRERPQSVTDLETQMITGMPRAGDAAFADYLINFGISYSFRKKNTDPIESNEKVKFE